MARERPVAVKVLRSNVAQGAERSLLEARTHSALLHPAVVEVLGQLLEGGERDVRLLVQRLSAETEQAR